MAREICIQNSRLIKRPLGIADIIGGTGWKYGTLDDHGRIDTGKIKPDGPLVIYDTSRIGRGVQIIGIENSKEIKLALPVPSTDRDVTLLYEIAEKTGYSDPKYFSKVFREATGLTPAEYRKNDQASR
jgi:hypothetical protein